MSRWAAVLYGLYHPSTPVGLRELAYHGRELANDARAGDLRAAAESKTKLDLAWKEVRPEAHTDAGASFTAKKYEETLSALHDAIAASDANAVASAARRGLAAVGVMETLLTD